MNITVSFLLDFAPASFLKNENATRTLGVQNNAENKGARARAGATEEESAERANRATSGKNY